MLAQKIDAVLELGSGTEPDFQTALDTLADALDARTATLHRANRQTRTLHMLASRGIPGALLAVTSLIPFGKGMAGLCAERRDLVTVCNLQTDDSGVARPAARETGIAGAIVVPIFDAGDDSLLGTLGVGMAGEHEYTENECGTLMACARSFARAVGTL